jgi:hypothetical protein
MVPVSIQLKTIRQLSVDKYHYIINFSESR